MKHERYVPIYEEDDLGAFEFLSIGKNGTVKKRIAFERTAIKDIYSLSLASIRNDGSLDFDDISDNGDRNKVLATVARAVEIYTTRYPKRLIYFKGNSPTRTRLYRMAIGLNLEELSQSFEIFAVVEGRTYPIPFQRNMEVMAFLIRRIIS
jgi:hypothetical protein